MEQHDIQNLIMHPEMLDEDTLVYLRGLVARYPYFQTAWMLYLKNLFILGKKQFKNELKRGALFVADLSLLFYYIEGERFLIKEHDTEAEISVSSGSDRTLDLIDRFLSDLPEQDERGRNVTGMSVPIEVPTDYTSVLLSEVDDTEKTASPLNGHELIDQFLERTDVGDVDLENGSKDSNADDMLEGVENNNSIPMESEEPIVQDDEEFTNSEESYFTETLAKIYVRQQRYDKALEIIKKLNLKYPKKNAYFADQIRFLEKLIINAKSK